MEEDIDKILNTDFIEEVDRFRDKTAPEIIKILNKENYLVATGVIGLAIVIRTIVENIGSDLLQDYAIQTIKGETIEIPVSKPDQSSDTD